MGVEEIIGTAIAVLVICSFVLCMVIFFFSWASGYLNNYNEQEELKRQRFERERKEREAADAERIKNAHKVRTQYPPPGGNVTFEVTNMRESIVVTEVVYAD